MKKYNWVYDASFLFISFLMFWFVFNFQVDSNYSPDFVKEHFPSFLISTSTQTLAAFLALRSLAKWLINKESKLLRAFVFSAGYALILVILYHVDSLLADLAVADIYLNMILSFMIALLFWVISFAFPDFGTWKSSLLHPESTNENTETVLFLATPFEFRAKNSLDMIHLLQERSVSLSIEEKHTLETFLSDLAAAHEYYQSIRVEHREKMTDEVSDLFSIIEKECEEIFTALDENQMTRLKKLVNKHKLYEKE